MVHVVDESDWRWALPPLEGEGVRLRELRASDAGALLELLTEPEVAAHISMPPPTVDAFEGFIAWTHRERSMGESVCFGIVPKGLSDAVGLIQVRRLDPSFFVAEWGFAIGAAFWGTGIFVEGAKVIIDFAFEVLGVHRLEARAALKNGRGNGALRKLGAVQEGVLRRSFVRNGEYMDQALWTILHDEWMHAKTVWGNRTMH